jgi:predicted nucleotidyltransferase
MAGAAIPVISPEDLIVTKILAGRSKDLEDVRGILKERRASLDLDHIRETLDLLEQSPRAERPAPCPRTELNRLAE